MALRAYVSTMIHGTETAGRIFDDPKVMFFGDQSNCVHIRGEAEKMNGKNCFGARTNALLDASGVDVKSLKVNITKNNHSPEVFHDVSSGDPSKGWNNRFVTWTKAKRG